MTSPFHGKWSLYGTHNLGAFIDVLPLPHQFKCAMKQVRTCEDVHVNGDNVHVSVCVPTYSVPAHGKDISFQFGVEHEQSLPFGMSGKVIVNKDGDHKWVAKVKPNAGACASACATKAAESCECTITREIRNGEMWVTMEGKEGCKMVRKFERCAEICPMTGNKIECAAQQNASPFHGCWRLYGSENFDKFMEKVCVPPHWRNLFANMCVRESIHINGNDVHIKICLPEIVVPAHRHEFDFKFDEQAEYPLPFGHSVKATVAKVSDTKWHAKVVCPNFGEGAVTRELVNGEMWITIEIAGKSVIRKFERAQCPSVCN